MEVVESTHNLFDQYIQIKYENMEEENFTGKKITIECTGFHNPIYRDVWYGFGITTFDGEIDYSEINLLAEIERSGDIGLDATDYVPAALTGD